MTGAGIEGVGASTAWAPWRPSQAPVDGGGPARVPALRQVGRNVPMTLASSGALRLAVAGCLGVAYALGAWVPFWYLSPTGGVAFFPPAGLTVATLMLTPRRTWPLWLAAFGAAELGVDLAHHQAAAATIGFVLANILEPFVGASLFRASVRRWDGYRARTVAFAVCGAVVGPLVGAVVGATTVALLPPPAHGWWATAATWWLGDALGVVVVGSAVLAWAHWPFYRHRTSVSLPAITALAAGTAGVIIATAVVWHLPAVVATLPVLIWTAFGGGALAMTAVGAAVAAASDWAALTGRASRLLGPATPAQHLEALQAYLGVTLLTVLFLAAEVAERRKAQHERLESEKAAVALAEAERRSISQDTHDIVGHGLAAMLLQLGAARQVLQRAPEQAAELLASAEAIGRGACRDLEMALATLGREAAPGGHKLAELPELVAGLSKAGLQVTLDSDTDERELPRLLDWSAYRIAQEALANVARHAPGATTAVTIRVGERELCLSVVDDGARKGGAAPRPEGRGIAGMRERASAVGGTLEASPRNGGGFMVVARLPL